MVKSNSLALILAAGKGSRMNSDIPKPLVNVSGKPIISWLIADFIKNNIDVSIIINPIDLSAFRYYENQVDFIFQKNPKGTGHAVMQAENKFKDYDNIFVFVGDCPFVGKNNIRKMLDNHIKTQSDLTILSSLFKEKKFPYARIIRSLDGHIIKCIEEINANKEQKKVNELFCSHYIFKSNVLLKYLKKLIPDKINGEIYLTEIINELIEDEKLISSLIVDNWKQLVGLNTKKEIDWIEKQKIV